MFPGLLPSRRLHFACIFSPLSRRFLASPIVFYLTVSFLDRPVQFVMFPCSAICFLCSKSLPYPMARFSTLFRVKNLTETSLSSWFCLSTLLFKTMSFLSNCIHQDNNLTLAHRFAISIYIHPSNFPPIPSHFHAGQLSKMGIFTFAIPPKTMAKMWVSLSPLRHCEFQIPCWPTDSFSLTTYPPQLFTKAEPVSTFGSVPIRKTILHFNSFLWSANIGDNYSCASHVFLSFLVFRRWSIVSLTYPVLFHHEPTRLDFSSTSTLNDRSTYFYYHCSCYSSFIFFATMTIRLTNSWSLPFLIAPHKPYPVIVSRRISKLVTLAGYCIHSTTVPCNTRFFLVVPSERMNVIG